MTTHTIPADHLDAARGGVLVVDGVDYITEWWPDQSVKTHAVQAPAEFVKLTEPCETYGCDNGIRRVMGRGDGQSCPACDGSGRPWLTINVACITRADLCDHSECGGGAIRAHVIDVVPIHGMGDEPPERGQYVRQYPHDPQIAMRHWPEGALCGGGNWPQPIDLPPGDHVGRYAVLIEPEEQA